MGLPDGSGQLAAHLERGLGDGYAVRAPEMPEPDNPRFEPWRARIEQELRSLGDDAILVGHSLGGSVLLKQLADAGHEKRIAGLFLVAVPVWGEEMEEWMLPRGFGADLPSIPRVVLYHSRDDPHAPFSHMARYADALPGAITRPLDGDSHSFTEGLPELVDDIRGL